MELEPPRHLPRGMSSDRPMRFGSGSDMYDQSRSVRNCLANPTGMRTLMLRSDPPASTSSTRLAGSWLRRLASTQPAEPAPTTMKSKSSGMGWTLLRRRGRAQEVRHVLGHRPEVAGPDARG